MKPGTILIILIVIIPWIIMIFYLLARKKKTVKYFQKLQEKYSLVSVSSDRNKPEITGGYRSRTVRIETETPEGKKKTGTVLEVACENDAGFVFTLVKRTKRNNPLYSSGAVMLDDKEFDDKFIIQANDAERVKRLFDFNTRFKLQQVCDLGFDGEIKLRGNLFTYYEPVLLNNDMILMRLELVLHELCDLADVLKYN